MSADWNPTQYERFKDERSRPFFDLLEIVASVDRGPPAPRVVDLGCGTGELTRELHRRLRATETLGLDSSPAMLAKAVAFAGDGLQFVRADIDQFADPDGFDVVFSNAALHWLPNHERLFARLATLVRPGGVLAAQMPANNDYPSHVVASEVAREPEFAAALGRYERPWHVLAPEDYAALLHRLGFVDLDVRLQVYAHELESRGDVVEWVRGTLLTDYEKRLAPETFARFLARYREALLPRLADERPFFYPFKRVLLRGRRPA
jgi:trans-aconitate 2-methyltransferase